jgi:hypothetical protein
MPITGSGTWPNLLCLGGFAVAWWLIGLTCSGRARRLGVWAGMAVPAQRLAALVGWALPGAVPGWTLLAGLCRARRLHGCLIGLT